MIFLPTNSMNQKGFTLIEVIIAISILTIGILAAGNMQLSALRGNSNAKQLTLAVVWGGAHLEEIMGKSYDDDDLQEKKAKSSVVDGLAYTDVAGKSADYKKNIDSTFTMFWNVADAYPIFGCKTVRVIVRRNDHGLSKDTSLDFIKMKSI